MNNASRSLPAATNCAIVAIAAGALILSFAALEDLAVQAGQPEELAWIYPVIVDGATLQATIRSWRSLHALAHGSASRFFWQR